jgi:hypothetical protein
MTPLWDHELVLRVVVLSSGAYRDVIATLQSSTLVVASEAVQAVSYRASCSHPRSRALGIAGSFSDG